ncbi:MAG TPA: DUF177 domain-containing protein [Sphingomicrobium sp.]|nr:DUF177 domain-containing protein [Sphingomicrobium sp.]
MTDGFAHQLRLDQIRDGERIDLSADEAERSAICNRLGVEAVKRLDAHAMLTRSGETVRAEGRLAAALVQSCVITGDPVSTHVDEPFELVFMPEPTGDPDDEVELGADDCDVVFYEGGAIDLGGAIADTLGLSLDPYPRSAGADASLKEAGVMSEEQASPFAILAKLRKNEDG